MKDLVCNKKLAAKDDLVLGEDFELADDAKKARSSDKQIVMATTTEKQLLQTPIDAVAEIEEQERSDHLHYRRGGLDQVLAKELAEKNAFLILSYGLVRRSERPHVVIGRMKQNCKIARKYCVKVLLATLAQNEQEKIETHDLKSFFSAMGISREIIDNQEKWWSEWVEQARHRQSRQYVAEGVKRVKK